MFGYEQFIDLVAEVFGLVGVGIILVGFLVSVVHLARLWPRANPSVAYVTIRSSFGRSILLGLEVLVAGDIIRTVALKPAIMNLSVLGLLVAIRTFLAWSLEVEIDGRWPWTRAEADMDHAEPPIG